jgi:hypothetical protein
MAGWEDLESLPLPDIREANQQRDDIARLCLRVFSTEDGSKLLEWLQAMYVDVPVAVPGADPSHAFFAEGQRNVVRDLKARIQQARKL